MTASPAPTPDPSAPRARSPVRGVLLGALLVGVGMALGRSMDPAEKTGASGSRDEAVRDEARRRAESETDRGRRARASGETSSKGWKDIAVRVWNKFNSDRILLVAAGVTFYAILAIFPAIAALVSVYGLIADPTTIHHHVNDLRGVLPDGALDIIGGQVQRLVANSGGTLGLTLGASLLLSLWSANGGVKSVFDALNIAYEEPERRSFVGLTLQSLLFTGGALLFVILALTGIVIVPVALQFFGLDQQAWYVALLRWPALLLILIFSLAVLYRFGPSRNKPQWRWVSPGGVLAAVLWVLASVLFSYYVGHFGSYDKTYGSLGAAIGFMTWIWISTIVVLLGAELNAEMERQRLEDATTGDEEPPAPAKRSGEPAPHKIADMGQRPAARFETRVP
jgi:membrane protein